MRNFRNILPVITVLVLSASAAYGQLSNGCPSDGRKYDADTRLNYLQSALRENRVEQQARCVTAVIDSLAGAPSNRAMEILLKLADFERPPSDLEKSGYLTHAMLPTYVYPALGTLVADGESATPSLVTYIANCESAKLRTNVTAALTSIYGSEPEKAVTALREAAKKADKTQAVRLYAAIDEVVRRCANRKTQCEDARNRID